MTELSTSVDGEILAVAENIEIIDMPDGKPCYVCKEPAQIAIAHQIAEAEGRIVYYLLAAHQRSVEETVAGAKKTIVLVEPRIFRVLNSMVSRSTVAVETGTLSLAATTGGANYKMPAIPRSMILTLERFFKVADREMGGSEAIVVLTYDTRCSDSSGWGFVVPEQTNSAAHCKYEPSTVDDMIPDEDLKYISIVGTAHSHPKMSAFASHTDENDQKGNDGVHITFGWKTEADIEYYIELQCADTVYTLQPEQVFEGALDLKKDEELDGYLAKITKAANLPKVPSTTQGGQTTSWTSTASNLPSGYYKYKETHIHESVPNPGENIIVVGKNPAAKYAPAVHTCPICFEPASDAMKSSQHCMICGTYWLEGDDTLEDLIETQKALNFPTTELEGLSAKPVKLLTRIAGSVPLKWQAETLKPGVGKELGTGGKV